MKLLYIANECNAGSTNFFSASVLAARQCGFEVHLAYNCINRTDALISKMENDLHVTFHQIDFVRSPYNLKNRFAFEQLEELIKQERFDVVHTNTPIGGVIGRLISKKCGIKKVIYQAHGFHFWKGAPLINWMLYYPVERLLANFTDALITINQEDYECAQHFHLRNGGKVYYVPGVGIDLGQYGYQVDIRNKKRNELGLSPKDIMLISAGDLINRKNYKVAIESIAKAKNKQLHYYICGQGPDESSLKALTNSLQLNDQVQFMGYRSDINELLQASDIFFLTSLQEGLPRSTMEAMASGLPCIVSNIRGNVDLIRNNINGYLCDVKDSRAFAEAITKLANNPELRANMKDANLSCIKEYDVSVAKKAIETIYQDILI